MKEAMLKIFGGSADAAQKVVGTEARIVKSGERFGLFVPAHIPAEYYEDHLNSMTLRTGSVNQQPGVFIYCKDSNLRSVFAGQCVDFLREDNFSAIMQDPFKWWNGLKALYGNVLADSNHYFVFAEFLTYIYLVKKYGCAAEGVKVTWKSCGAMHDIESSDGAQHEVKSTIRHSASRITISSKFQMAIGEDVPFLLYFLRVEPDRADGFSISDLMAAARALGCDMERVSTILSSQGLGDGSPKRKTKFFVSEARCYDAAGPQFPRLTPDSFKVEHANVLAAVENFSYDINLSALKCHNVDILPALNQVMAQR